MNKKTPAWNLIDLAGKKFDKLTVQGRGASDADGKAKWNCKCVCGNITLVAGKSLRKGLTTSCGCNRQRSRRTLPAGEASFNQLLKSYQRGARERNLEWRLTNNECRNLFKHQCHYCGIAPSQFSETGKYNGTFKYNGIDRVDNKLGYILENCVTACGKCNRSKSQMSTMEFLNWIKRINDYLAPPKTIYLCAPMSNLRNHNFPALDSARDKLKAIGYTIISPADLDREAGFNPSSTWGDKELHEVVRRDIDAILRSDWVVLLPGTENSIGATAEIKVARWLRKPIYPINELLPK